MNREQAKQLLPIIQAFADGKDIQFLLVDESEEWRTIDEPSFDSCITYRIKPEPMKFWVCHFTTSGGVPGSVTSDPKDVEVWKKYPHLYDVREYTYEKE